MITWLLLVVLIGLLPAAIARGKGRSFGLWWFYGSMMFILALPHALLLRVDQGRLDHQALRGGDSKACPHCAEIIRSQARVCRYCGRDVV